MRKIIVLSIIIMIMYITPISADYAINLSYRDLQNNEIKFSKYNGSILLVEAFSTECPHCLAEHAQLVDVYNSNLNISMLSLSIDKNDNIDKLLSYNNSYPTPWDLGLDIESNYMTQYNIQATPTMILFDENGKFANYWIGETDNKTLIDEIRTMQKDPVSYIQLHGGDKVPDYNPGINYIFYGIIGTGTIIMYYIIKLVFSKKR